MSGPRYTIKEVGCPRCGANPGEPCVRVDGSEARTFHDQRSEQAQTINERIVSDYWVRLRAELRGGPPRVPRPCGTRAAAVRHQHHGEPLDAACAEALRAWERERSRRRRAAA